MIFKNAQIYGRKTLSSIEVKEGKIYKITNKNEYNASGDEQIIDLNGALVTDPFVESHIHLDYAFTAGKPRWNNKGTLFEGIKIWSEYKKQFTNSKKEIKLRSKKAVELLVKNGVQHIRTHVDVTDPSFLNFESLLELKDEMRDLVNIQLVAFPQEGMYSYPKGEELVEEAIKMGAEVVGGIPYYEHTEENGVKSIQKAMKLAYKYDKLVDIHCDETDDTHSRFVESLAFEAYKYGMGEMVSASHTTAMGSYNNSYMEKLMNILKESKINIISLPKANVHLQGRGDSFPKRRGVTRIKELLAEDINVSFGMDSIKDPWYPLGNGSLLNTVEFGLHIAHMTDYDHISKGLDLITINGAKSLNITDEYGIREGNKANFIVLNAVNEYDAIHYMPEVLFSVKNGEIIMKTSPSEPTILNSSEDMIEK